MQRESARSEWSLQLPNHEAIVKPIHEPINAQLHVSGSKSYTNRALIIAALADGTSHLKGVLKSDDSFWCIDALKRLGIKVTVDGDDVHMDGCSGQWPTKQNDLFIGSSGTIARFLPGALAASSNGRWTVDGIKQLQQRPLKPLIDALQQLGASIDYLSANEGLPLLVHGSRLKGGHVTIPGDVSSQFLSGLLIASPLAEQEVTIQVEHDLVQPAYIGITVQLMRQFGADVEHSADFMSFKIKPTGYKGRHTVLEADASTACYFLSIGALTSGTVRVTNVGYDSYQPDAKFVDVLEQMGCSVVKDATFLQVTGVEQLKGGFTVDMKPMSDQALTIAALAPFADAPITVTNVAHIRQHESDRIAVICDSLRTIGVQVEEHHDGFTVYPMDKTIEKHGTEKLTLQPLVTLDPHDDHRQAMVYALLSLKIGGIRILDPGCVSKTCPTFFKELARLGVSTQFRERT